MLRFVGPVWLRSVFSQYRFFRPTQSLTPASVLWCAVRSAPIYTQTEQAKQRAASRSVPLPRHRRCEGMSDLSPMLVSRTGRCEKVMAQCCSYYSPGFPPSDSCTFSNAHATLSKRPSESGKTARWPLKRHPEEFPHIESYWKFMGMQLHWATFCFLNLIIIAKLYLKSMQLYTVMKVRTTVFLCEQKIFS